MTREMTLSRCTLGINGKRLSRSLWASSLWAKDTSKHVPSPLELPGSLLAKLTTITGVNFGNGQTLVSCFKRKQFVDTLPITSLYLLIGRIHLMQTWPLSPFLAYRCCKENTSGWKKLLCHESKFYFRAYFSMLNRDKSSFANLVPRYFSLVNLNMRKGPLHVYMEMEQAINNNIFIKLLFSLACRLFFTQVWQT